MSQSLVIKKDIYKVNTYGEAVLRTDRLKVKGFEEDGDSNFERSIGGSSGLLPLNKLFG